MDPVVHDSLYTMLNGLLDIQDARDNLNNCGINVQLIDIALELIKNFSLEGTEITEAEKNKIEGELKCIAVKLQR